MTPWSPESILQGVYFGLVALATAFDTRCLQPKQVTTLRSAQSSTETSRRSHACAHHAPPSRQAPRLRGAASPLANSGLSRGGASAYLALCVFTRAQLCTRAPGALTPRAGALKHMAMPSSTASTRATAARAAGLGGRTGGKAFRASITHTRSAQCSLNPTLGRACWWQGSRDGKRPSQAGCCCHLRRAQSEPAAPRVAGGLYCIQLSHPSRLYRSRRRSSGEVWAPLRRAAKLGARAHGARTCGAHTHTRARVRALRGHCADALTRSGHRSGEATGWVSACRLQMQDARCT